MGTGTADQARVRHVMCTHCRSAVQWGAVSCSGPRHPWSLIPCTLGVTVDDRSLDWLTAKRSKLTPGRAIKETGKRARGEPAKGQAQRPHPAIDSTIVCMSPNSHAHALTQHSRSHDACMHTCGRLGGSSEGLGCRELQLQRSASPEAGGLQGGRMQPPHNPHNARHAPTSKQHAQHGRSNMVQPSHTLPAVCRRTCS